jgi:fructose-bisphosphate aldolase class II
VPLVLYGSSGANDQLGRATRAGMSKINVGTRLNRAFTDSVRKSLASNADLVDVRKYLAPAREALRAARRTSISALSP